MKIIELLLIKPDNSKMQHWILRILKISITMQRFQNKTKTKENSKQKILKVQMMMKSTNKNYH